MFLNAYFLLLVCNAEKCIFSHFCFVVFVCSSSNCGESSKLKLVSTKLVAALHKYLQKQ